MEALARYAFGKVSVRPDKKAFQKGHLVIHGRIEQNSAAPRPSARLLRLTFA